jgi:hypothetical protein
MDCELICEKTTSIIHGQSEKLARDSTEPLCLVQRVHETDDIDHLPSWKRRLNRFTPLFSVVAVTSYWVYFVFRIKYTIAAQRANNQVYGMAWAFIAVEMGVACKSIQAPLHYTT